MALPAGKFLQTYISQCYPCCDEVILHVRLEALLQSAAHQGAWSTVAKGGLKMLSLLKSFTGAGLPPLA